ncbi:RDD family protein [Flavobacteriaceae bacterium R38]|nr:RDD family protein [Flavobacteriaceae bacterium R38]
MSELQINTTQNVKISFTAAGVGERLIAFLIDATIKWGYIFITNFILGLIGIGGFFDEMDGWSFVALKIIIGAPAMFYTVVLESFLGGQTLGKKIMKIRVVKIDGYQASFADYLVRWFFRIVDVYFFALGFFVIVFNKRNQRIGDMATGTAVILLKDKVKISHTILENISDNYIPSYPNVIRLSDNDARIIKETFMVAKKTSDHATLLKLKSKIEEVTGTKSTERDTHSYINKILKDYNYYTQNM